MNIVSVGGSLLAFGILLAPVFSGTRLVLDPSRDLERGRDLYERHCSVCHGSEGRGDGQAAYLLCPAPRNFAGGRFRLVSTENGVPTQGDLVAGIRRGMPGSAMPAWGWLAEEDLWNLGLYVKHLWLEGQVADLLTWAEEEQDEIDAAAIEISVERDPPLFAMGAMEHPVDIAFWRAAWVPTERALLGVEPPEELARPKADLDQSHGGCGSCSSGSDVG